jgi:hypothetical protein
MAKANDLATALLEKTGGIKEKKEFKESFEVTKPALMSGFRGMFGEHVLSQQEKERLAYILQEHAQSSSTIEEDCKDLSRLTSEIKAISNQSILLHGERIKKAQHILKGYKEGAFTAWLLATYGNRQTPYSMLQYYELYCLLPQSEKGLIENLPKKAAYTLASRQGELEEKRVILRSYKGERQQDFLMRIRQALPKNGDDTRSISVNMILLKELDRFVTKLETMPHSLAKTERTQLIGLISRLQALC